MRRSAVFVLAALWVSAAQADELDLILERATLPPALRYQHGYSDFTDPLGRFMDLLSVGAVDDARAVEPDACRTWLTTRDRSGWSGKFWVWNVEVSLDQLCAAR
jgi:hypothetical protein